MKRRGSPKRGDYVHRETFLKTHTKYEPLCRNGSYHLWLAHNKREVTCPKCLDKMKQRGEV